MQPKISAPPFSSEAVACQVATPRVFAPPRSCPACSLAQPPPPLPRRRRPRRRRPPASPARHQSLSPAQRSCRPAPPRAGLPRRPRRRCLQPRQSPAPQTAQACRPGRALQCVGVCVLWVGAEDDEGEVCGEVDPTHRALNQDDHGSVIRRNMSISMVQNAPQLRKMVNLLQSPRPMGHVLMVPAL